MLSSLVGGWVGHQALSLPFCLRTFESDPHGFVVWRCWQTQPRSLPDLDGVQRAVFSSLLCRWIAWFRLFSPLFVLIRYRAVPYLFAGLLRPPPPTRPQQPVSSVCVVYRTVFHIIGGSWTTAAADAANTTTTIGVAEEVPHRQEATAGIRRGYAAGSAHSLPSECGLCGNVH